MQKKKRKTRPASRTSSIVRGTSISFFIILFLAVLQVNLNLFGQDEGDLLVAGVKPEQAESEDSVLARAVAVAGRGHMLVSMAVSMIKPGGHGPEDELELMKELRENAREYGAEWILKQDESAGVRESAASDSLPEGTRTVASLPGSAAAGLPGLEYGQFVQPVQSGQFGGFTAGNPAGEKSEASAMALNPEEDAARDAVEKSERLSWNIFRYSAPTLSAYEEAREAD